MRGRTNYTGGAVPVINGNIIQCEVAPGSTINKGDFVEVVYKGNTGEVNLPIVVNWYNMFQKISGNKYLMQTKETDTGEALVLKIFEEQSGSFQEKKKLIIGELHTNLNFRSTKILDDGNIILVGKSADNSINIVVVKVDASSNTLTILQNKDIGKSANAYGIFKRGNKIIVFYDTADVVEYNYSSGTIDFSSANTMKLTVTASAYSSNQTAGTNYTSAWSLNKKMEQIDDNTYEYSFYGATKYGSSSSQSGYSIGNAIVKISGTSITESLMETAMRYSDGSGTKNPSTLDGCVNLNNNYFLYIFNYTNIRVRDKNQNTIHSINKKVRDDNYETGSNSTTNAWYQATIVRLDDYRYAVTRPYGVYGYGTEFFLITFDREYNNMAISNVIDHTFNYIKSGTTTSYKGNYKTIGGALTGDNTFFLILNRGDGTGWYKYFTIEDGVLKEGYEYGMSCVQPYTGNNKLMGFSNSAGKAGDVISINIPKATS